LLLPIAAQSGHLSDRRSASYAGIAPGEAWATLQIGWHIALGGIFALVAAIETVQYVHHKSVWFWAALGMTVPSSA
jgi:hypothetical protein